MAAQSSALPFFTSSILASHPDSIWLTEAIGTHRAKPISSGYRELDRELPNGGWPPSVLTELLLPHPAIGELRLLASILTNVIEAGKTVIVLAPSHLAIGTSLSELGINTNKVTLIEADKPEDKIWAVEQAMKSASFGALLSWLPQANEQHLRRLQLAAAPTKGWSFLFRPLDAQDQASPAALRMLCKPLSIGRLAVEIIKRRGPVHLDPIILPLEAPEIQLQPRTTRVLGTPIINSTSYDVDSTALAATAAKHRRTL